MYFYDFLYAPLNNGKISYVRCRDRNILQYIDISTILYTNKRGINITLTKLSHEYAERTVLKVITWKFQLYQLVLIVNAEILRKKVMFNYSKLNYFFFSLRLESAGKFLCLRTVLHLTISPTKYSEKSYVNRTLRIGCKDLALLL